MLLRASSCDRMGWGMDFLIKWRKTVKEVNSRHQFKKVFQFYTGSQCNALLSAYLMLASENSGKLLNILNYWSS